MSKQTANVPANEPVIELIHHYDAPRALVWECFTNPEHLVHWWGPDGFSIEHKSADFRVGGHWEFVMIGPDGKRWPNYHQYTAISPMDSFSHRHGAFANDPDAFFAAISFAGADGGTTATMRMTFPSLAARQFAIGYSADTLGLQTLSKLEAYLAHNAASA